MMVKRLSVALIGLGLALLLGSCGSVAGFPADHWPHWAGGLPAGTPPRPGTPGYADYVAHRQAETEPPKPAASAGGRAPTGPAPAAAEPHSDDDRPVARGGLY